MNWASGGKQKYYASVEKECLLPLMLAKIAETSGRRFIVIIDEWDALFREVKEDTKQQEYGMEFEDIKRWYDGYSFNRAKSVYSPNSVIQAISNQEVADEFKNAVEYSGLEDD